MIGLIAGLAITVFIIIFLLSGIRVIRPTHRGIIETLGNYSSFMAPGFRWIIPIFQSLHTKNVTEQMSHIQPQDIITKDNLNARVDLVVYYKIKSDEPSIKQAFYNVDNVEDQLDTLSRTTARNVIGTMEFKEVNSKRDILNQKLQVILGKETKLWGIDVLKVELKDITPPQDVQETMNKVIKAQNEKDAAVDTATALETEADGKRRAAIKEAQGISEGRIIVAKANAQKIQLENIAAHKYFKGNAVKLKQLEALQESLKGNSKVILGNGAKDILKLLDVEGKK